MLSVVRRVGVPFDVAAASTITLRAADMVAVVLLGLLAGPAAFLSLVGGLGWVIFVVLMLVAVWSWRWLASLVARRADAKLPGAMALGASVAAWLAESVLVWFAARWAGLDVVWVDIVFVTAIAVAAQVAAVAPGGFGTYEAAAVAAYAALGHDADQALVAALLAHALKTAYSLVTGAVAVVAPRPSLLGRFRLARELPQAPAHHLVPDEAPVVLFMPAYNEEASVAACVRRAPASVHGRPVER